jgi:hypothetical protein
VIKLINIHENCGRINEGQGNSKVPRRSQEFLEGVDFEFFVCKFGGIEFKFFL